MNPTHPDGSEDRPLDVPPTLAFDWKWDEVGYHGVDMDNFTTVEFISTQDADSIIASMHELRAKIQETIQLDVDEASAQVLLQFYNKLAKAHRYVKKFAGSSIPEMPRLEGTYPTIEVVRNAILAVRAPVV